MSYMVNIGLWYSLIIGNKGMLCDLDSSDILVSRSNNFFFIMSYAVNIGLWYSLIIGNNGMLCDLDSSDILVSSF